MIPTPTEQEAQFEQALKRLTDPLELYKKPPGEHEMDLVAAVRGKLAAFVEEDVLKEAFDSSRFIQEATGLNTAAQQYALTRYLNLQFTSAGTENDTRLDRFSLIYEVDTNDWLKIFEGRLLPSLVDKGLPKAI